MSWSKVSEQDAYKYPVVRVQHVYAPGSGDTVNDAIAHQTFTQLPKVSEPCHTSQWVDKQQVKLLPVPYFMVTFTLPRELRSLVYHHQKTVYTLLFNYAISTLKTFGLNPKHLGAEIGATMAMLRNYAL